MDIKAALKALEQNRLQEYLTEQNYFPPDKLIESTTFLHFATEEGAYELVEAVVNNFNADINTKKNNQTPLMWLLNHLMSINEKNENYSNYIKLAKFYIGHKSLDFNVIDAADNNLLHYAARLVNSEYLLGLMQRLKQLVLENKVEGPLAVWVNKKNKRSRTPLFAATQVELLGQENIELLLLAGADPSIAEVEDNKSTKPIDNVKRNNSDNITKENILALLSAAEKGLWPIAKLMEQEENPTGLALLSCCKLIDKTDDDDRTPLFYAASHGRLAYLKKLLERGSDCNKCDVALSTPLHAAAVAGHVEVVEYLISVGADLALKNKNHRTALEEVNEKIQKLQGAAAENFHIIARLLKDHNNSTRLIYIKKYTFEIALGIVFLLFIGLAALCFFAPFTPLVLTPWIINLGLTQLQAFMAVTAAAMGVVFAIEGIKVLCTMQRHNSASSAGTNIIEKNTYQVLSNQDLPELKDDAEESAYLSQFTAFLFSPCNRPQQKLRDQSISEAHYIKPSF